MMGAWRASCSQVQGKSHITSGIPCQDKTKKLILNDVKVIALADGAGSSKISQFGAECVTDCIAKFLANNFEKLYSLEDGAKARQVIYSVLINALTKRASQIGCQLGELASTLQAVAIKGNEFIVIHIGDGVIGYLRDDGLKVVSTPDNGEFANVTTFVTSKNALASMSIFKGKLDRISAFILMSDGSGFSLYHKPTKTLANAVLKLMQYTCLIDEDVMDANLKEVISDVIVRNTTDDCSLAIIARAKEPLFPYEKLKDNKKLELLEIPQYSKRKKKTLLKYDLILEYLNTPYKLYKISRKVRIKPNVLKPKLDRLLRVGLVRKEGEFYTRA